MKMSNENRKMIEVEIAGETFSLREFQYGTIDNAIEFLTNLRDSYPGKTLKLSVHQYPYSDEGYYQVYEKRLETDEEMELRIANEEVFAKTREQRERLEYERLKQKFSTQEGT
jgi:hypothetical protein